MTASYASFCDAAAPDDLAAIPKALLHYAQVCDAPALTPTRNEDMIFTARCARLLPGEGDIDPHGIMSALPANLPISLEVPNDSRKSQIGVEA